MADETPILATPVTGEPATTTAIASTPLLDVRDLVVRRGADGPPLVNGLSFQIKRGETIALVGESGAGKSLSARAVIGLLPPALRATGEIHFDGSQLIGMRESAWRTVRGHGIAMLLQDPFTVLNPLTRARTQILETLRSAGGEKLTRRRAADEVTRRLREVGITDPTVAERYPFELSGGMSQRVALACALAKDPALLIADEPTTAVDATTQHEVLRLLRSMQTSRGMGMLLITHDLRVAFSVCDRVYVMYAGGVMEQAKPADLVARPAHPYTVGLLCAEPPTDHRRDRLDGIPGVVPRVETVLNRCAFAERCAWSTPACVATRPPLQQVDETHASACLRRDRIGDELMAELRRARLGRHGEPTPTVSATVLLRVAGLRKSYRRDRTGWALDDVSLTVAQGRSLGIVGESGSGKTTLARCLLGLEEPTDGTLELLGTDVTRYSALSRTDLRRVRTQIQCVFQDPYSSLNRSHTVGFILREALGRRADGMGEPPTVTTLLERVGLAAEHARRRPAALSGGQRQRVAIARALALAPTVLVCDEPVAALDVSVQGQVLQVLREVRDDGTQLVFITHDLAVVRQMADDIVVLQRGKIVETGRTDAVLDSPAHPYTKRLIAAIPTGTAGWLS